MARSQGFELYALSFDYDQRHKNELLYAKRVGESLPVVDHKIIPLHLPLETSALTNRDIPIPDGDFTSTGIPITYVPGRNLIFLAIALSYAEDIGARDIFTGFNVVDYSGYPDCRPEFVEAVRTAANLGTKAGVEGEPFSIHTPLLRLSKGEIIRCGLSLGLDYALTWSCYKGSERACGRCDSCILRLEGFRQVGVSDPLEYEG